MQIFGDFFAVGVLIDHWINGRFEDALKAKCLCGIIVLQVVE